MLGICFAPLVFPERRCRAHSQLYPCDARGCPSLSQVKANAGFNLSGGGEQSNTGSVTTGVGAKKEM